MASLTYMKDREIIEIREVSFGTFFFFFFLKGGEGGWEDRQERWQTGRHGLDNGHIQEVSYTSSQLTRFVRVRG